MRYNISFASSKGQRTANQDALSVCGRVFPEVTHRDLHGSMIAAPDEDGGCLLCIADGMGGEAFGAAAAALALETMVSSFSPAESVTVLSPHQLRTREAVLPASLPLVLRPAAQLLPEHAESLQESQAPEEPGTAAGPDALNRRFRAAVQAACDAVYSLLGEEGGCTLCAAYAHSDGRVVWASVGDSSLSLFHSHEGSAKLTLLNERDNLYDSHKRAGLPAHKREKCVLLSYVGERCPKVHYGEARLRPGDALLLATDGVDLPHWVQKLFCKLDYPARNFVRYSSGKDNATALLLKAMP